MNCPECNAEIAWSAEELEDGELIFCDECDEQLEVVFLEDGGVVLDLAEDFEDTDDTLDDIEW
jgi:lysine biosynthesis protein LysW